MLKIISAILVAIAALLQFVALISMRSTADADGYGDVNLLLPGTIYGLAGGALAVGVGISAFGNHDVGHWVVLVGAVLAVAGPLVYGWVTGQFTLSHHLVRLVIVAAVTVFYWMAWD